MKRRSSFDLPGMKFGLERAYHSAGQLTQRQIESAAEVCHEILTLYRIGDPGGGDDGRSAGRIRDRLPAHPSPPTIE
jgi:hypothetical protein